MSSLYLYYCHSIFKIISPDAFKCLQATIDRENLTHAITKNIFVFKENVSEDAKKEANGAAKIIQSYFNDPQFCTLHMEEFSAFALSTIKGHLSHGLNVLSDGGWYVNEEAILKTTPNTKIVSVLAYCPFDIILKRILYRNKKSLESGNLANYRFFREPLKSFEALYYLRRDGEKSIDALEKTKFLACLEEIESYLPDNTDSTISSDFVAQDFTKEQLHEYRSSILEKFEKEETLNIVPKNTYELLLRTDIYTPQDCAGQIVTYVDHDSRKPNLDP